MSLVSSLRPARQVAYSCATLTPIAFCGHFLRSASASGILLRARCLTRFISRPMLSVTRIVNMTRATSFSTDMTTARRSGDVLSTQMANSAQKRLLQTKKCSMHPRRLPKISIQGTVVGVTLGAWALLRLPETARTFRFSYPTILAAAMHNAYLWDIPTSQQVSVVRNTNRCHHDQLLGTINYVEVNDSYVFICGGRGLRIFGREDGALLYQLSTVELSSATWDVLSQTRGLASSVVHPQMLLHNNHAPSPVHGEFMACMYLRFPGYEAGDRQRCLF